MLCYIEHVLYRLKNIKITFKYHQLINSKLYKLTFNYPNFYTISPFIQNYSSMVNHNTIYSKIAYKYLLKVFYNKTKKKEYNLQIWQYNI